MDVCAKPVCGLPRPCPALPCHPGSDPAAAHARLVGAVCYDVLITGLDSPAHQLARSSATERRRKGSEYNAVNIRISHRPDMTRMESTGETNGGPDMATGLRNPGSLEALSCGRVPAIFVKVS